MSKDYLRKYRAMFLLAVMTYPLLVQSVHIWHNHHKHNCHHHHVNGIALNKTHHDHNSACYVCNTHLAPYILTDNNDINTHTAYYLPQKFTIYTCTVQPYNGSDFALRAPPLCC